MNKNYDEENGDSGRAEKYAAVMNEQEKDMGDMSIAIPDIKEQLGIA